MSYFRFKLLKIGTCDNLNRSQKTITLINFIIIGLERAFLDYAVSGVELKVVLRDEISVFFRIITA